MMSLLTGRWSGALDYMLDISLLWAGCFLGAMCAPNPELSHHQMSLLEFGLISFLACMLLVPSPNLAACDLLSYSCPGCLAGGGLTAKEVWNLFNTTARQ